MPNKIEIMVDVASLGTSPGSVIACIGAVAFDQDRGISEHFCVNLDTERQLKTGLTIDPGISKWWMQQPDEVRRLVFRMETVFPRIACEILADFIEQFDKPLIWANPPQFDIVLLECLFDAFGVKLPWGYKSIRDLRDVVSTCNIQPGVIERGIENYPLKDAIYQTHQLTMIRTLHQKMAA